MSRAFLLEPVRPNISVSPESVRAYGELVVLFPHGFPLPAAAPDFDERVITELERHEFDPYVDYLIVSGKLSRLTCTATLMAVLYEELTLLVFSERDMAYLPVRYAVDDLSSESEEDNERATDSRCGGAVPSREEPPRGYVRDDTEDRADCPDARAS